MVAVIVATLSLGCKKEQAPPGVIAEARAATLVSYSARPAPADQIQIPNDEAEDGQWVRPAKDFSATRFSKLNQINTTNVGALHAVVTFSTGIDKGHEAAPLVVNNTMYVVTPFPNIVYALDLTKPGAPAKWTYKPKPKSSSQGVACCDVVNRGASYADGKIVFNTLDGNTIALDANDGHELWRTQLANINLGESLTMAPLIAKNKVLVGVSGSEFGIRG
ncbi:MAG: PQQ-binding-like beta-propeller repeat protein, partial [Gemmatimonadaceae bacterium]